MECTSLRSKVSFTDCSYSGLLANSKGGGGNLIKGEPPPQLPPPLSWCAHNFAVCVYVFVDFTFYSLLKSESDNADLLYHPLVRSLLKYKWESFGHKLFFANLLLYLLFLLCLTAFALMSLGPLEQTCKQKLRQISLVV